MARTFGRPFRKMQAALLPIMFKLGVMATLIFLTFLLSLKSVSIGMLLLLMKFAGIFLKFKSQWNNHHAMPEAWYPHQKEVHLHVLGGPPSGYGGSPLAYGGSSLTHGGPPVVESNPYSSETDGWNRLDASSLVAKKHSPYQYYQQGLNSHHGLTSQQELTSNQGLTSHQGLSSYQSSSHQGLTSSHSISPHQGLTTVKGPSAVNTPYGHYVRTGDSTSSSSR